MTRSKLNNAPNKVRHRFKVCVTISYLGKGSKKKYGNFHKGGGVKPVSHFFFFFLYPQFIQKCIKKIFLLGGGYPRKKNPKGPPFGYFGKIFKISKKSPIIKKSQGSPLWIFWEILQNFQKISNNGLLLKKNKILFSIL